MSSIHPKPPAKSRAVIVGLEKYALHTLRGPVAEALKIARTIEDMGVNPGRIDLWLAPADAQSALLADASGIPWKPFDEQKFIDFMLDDLSADTQGGTLYLHWCGHGLSRRQNNRTEHHLLLPASKSTRLESLELDELTSHLVDEDHVKFGHLVFVLDTCRESARAWGDVHLVPRNLGSKGPANGPLYCTLFVCPEGQTTTYTTSGSLNGSVLRTILKQAPHGEWPDFKVVLQDAAGVHRHGAVDRVDRADAVQARQRQHHRGAAGVWHAAQHQAGLAALRHQRNTGLSAGEHQLRHLLRDVRAQHGQRAAGEAATPVGEIRRTVLLCCQHIIVADDRAAALQEFSTHF